MIRRFGVALITKISLEEVKEKYPDEKLFACNSGTAVVSFSNKFTDERIRLGDLDLDGQIKVFAFQREESEEEVIKEW